jgi:hypothetical protein
VALCEFNLEIECASPKQVKNIDIFMGPLIDELKIMWKEVPKTYDAHCKEFSNLKTMLVWIMMDI